MIDFACPSCGKVFHVDDALAGKQAKCRACGHRLTVPSCFFEDDVTGTLDLASLDGSSDALFPDGQEEFDAGSMPAMDIESPSELAKRMARGHRNEQTQNKKTEHSLDEHVVAVGCLVVLGVCVLTTVLMCSGMLTGTRQAQQKPGQATQHERSRVRIGQEGVLYAETGGTNLPVAVNEEAYSEMLAAGSDRVLAVMVMNGDAFLAPRGTRVKVLTGGPWGCSRVLILDGPTVGRRGFVPSDFVRHR